MELTGFSVEPMEGEDIDEELMEELKQLASAGASKVGETMTVEGFAAKSHGEILARLTGLRTRFRLPSVRMYLDDLKYSDHQLWNFTRVLGAGRHGSMGYGREVPWEKEDADFGWEFVPAGDEDDE